MIKSSVKHYETLSGPNAPCLVRTCRCPIKQKLYTDIANRKQFKLQMQYDIPLIQKIKYDDRIYFRKCRLILREKGLDPLVQNIIIEYLYYSKEDFVFGNKYICKLKEIEYKNRDLRYMMDNLEFIINHTKYLSLEEKVKALKYKQHTENQTEYFGSKLYILNKINNRIPEDERFILELYMSLNLLPNGLFPIF